MASFIGKKRCLLAEPLKFVPVFKENKASLLIFLGTIYYIIIDVITGII